VWLLETPEAMKSLASRLAPFVSEIDFIALRGPLGAGKTTFAQGLLPALGVTEAITSPTYQLVHSYAGTNRQIFHCDFYRLAPQEEEEIGFRELCSQGVVIAEWPETVEEIIPPDRLEVQIEGEGSTRSVSLTGLGTWQKKLERFREVEAFLVNGWGGSLCTAVKGDASVRVFSRLTQGGDHAMLMNWPLQSDGPPILNGRPYCDIAHLAREGTPFLAISEWLRKKAGLSAPAVLMADRERGLYLVDDLGDALFGQLIAEGAPLDPLYTLAVEGLLSLHASKPPRELPAPDATNYRLPEFDREAIEIELDLLLQWYFALIGSPLSDEITQAFFEAWSPFIAWLDSQPKGLVLRDFHSPNLLLCEKRSGLQRLGVIDFQDAVWGHPAYDLVSLLQDARLNVPEQSERTLFRKYCDSMERHEPAFDREAFAKAYAILGAQRNTKILGIFARLSRRDGKHGYLAHLPRIQSYLFRNLAHPDLKPLRAWYEAHLRPEADGGFPAALR